MTAWIVAIAALVIAAVLASAWLYGHWGFWRDNE